MRIIFSIILTFISAAFGEQVINFIPDVLSNSTPYVDTLFSKPIEVNTFTVKQKLIMVTMLAPLKIHCRVTPLKQEYSIKEAYLCRKISITSSPICINVMNIKMAILERANFDITFDKLNGFTASLKLDIETYLYGYFYCELRNDIDAIISNNIEMHDLRYYNIIVRNQIEPFYDLKKHDLSDGDILDCGKKTDITFEIPSWIEPLLMPRFKWYLCSDMSEDYFCIYPIESQFKENEHFQLFSNNSIRLFDNIFEKHKRFRMQCINIESRIYARYDVFLSNSNYFPIRDELVNFSPSEVTLKMRAGIFVENQYKLSVAYMSSYNLSYSWEKDMAPLNKVFVQSSRSVIFPKMIEQSFNGTYTLYVYQRGPPIVKTFKFHVIIIDFPQISHECHLQPISYIMSKQPLNLKTRFDGDFTETSIKINKMRISTDSHTSIMNDLRLVKKTYPYLRSMQLSVVKKDQNHSTEFIYKATDIDGLWFKKGYSHRITFTVVNDIGSLIQSTLVKVIEQPKWKTTLDQYNCVDNCYSSEPHYFKCSIYPNEYIDIGLLVTYNWKINGVDFDTMFSDELRELYFDFEDGLFIIKNIASDDHARDMRVIETFTNSTLSCSVILSVRQKSGSKLAYEQIYDSSYDPDLSASLSKANVNIISRDYLGDSSNSLVLIICIPLIVAAVAGTILASVIYLGRHGQTYDIDREERNAGKDPEREMKENLYFKHYHREEENDTSIVHDTISWIRLGNKADNGDVNSCESDTEDFDEGSIIGKYTVI